MLHQSKHILEDNKDGQSNLVIDMHSHLLPYVDNGPKDMVTAVEICNKLYNFGIKKCILTPHIMTGFYENSEEEIFLLAEDLKRNLVKENVKIKLKASAEYFLDDMFFLKLKKNHKLLTLDSTYNHVLIGLNFLFDIDYFIYGIKRLNDFGYIPVLANSERYFLLFENPEYLSILKNEGLKIQADITSLFAINSKSIKSNIKYLIERNLIDFVGTNINTIECCVHLPELKNNPDYKNLFQNNIQNNILDF